MCTCSRYRLTPSKSYVVVVRTEFCKVIALMTMCVVGAVWHTSKCEQIWIHILLVKSLVCENMSRLVD
jgi:hypothetical protein